MFIIMDKRLQIRKYIVESILVGYSYKAKKLLRSDDGG